MSGALTCGHAGGQVLEDTKEGDRKYSMYSFLNFMAAHPPGIESLDDQKLQEWAHQRI